MSKVMFIYRRINVLQVFGPGKKLNKAWLQKPIMKKNSNGSQFPGTPLEPGPGVGLEGEALVAGPFPMGPGTARGTPFQWAHHLQEGSWGRVQCETGGGRRRGPWRSDPRLQKLALGTWNVISLGGKEPELVRDVEKFRLDIVGLASTHSIGSLRGAGLSSTLELPLVRDVELGWECLFPLGSAPVRWGSPRWTRG